MSIISRDLVYKMHEYSDFELAFLLKNRYGNLTPESQQTLVYEVKQRELSPARLTDLMEEKLAYSGSYGMGECSKCSSDKIEFPEVVNKGGEKKYYICSVCGHHTFKEAMQANAAKSKKVAILAAAILIIVLSLVMFLVQA